MNSVGTATAKLAGIRKSIISMLDESPRWQGSPKSNWAPEDVAYQIKSAERQLIVLTAELPYLFDDIPSFAVEPIIRMNEGQLHYGRAQLERLVRDIQQIFEIRANSDLGQSSIKLELKRKIFISHGHAADWREVQAFIERDLSFATVELAQEASQGMTIIEKLFDQSETCDSAVIVMTGDDIGSDPKGQTRARENVMHEIGFFQGKYGRRHAILLHEDGVTIPTNLSGIVYIPFPKGTISAGFHVLARELKAIYKSD